MTASPPDPAAPVAGNDGSGGFDGGECLAMLARTTVGRVGLVVDGLPYVHPVRMAVEGGHVLIGVSGETLAAAIDDVVIALQADGFEEDRGRRWSVLAVGPASPVDLATGPRPYPVAAEPYAFRLRPRVLSGGWLA